MSRGRIFALTWLSYFSYYQTRKNLSFAKSEIEKAGLVNLSGFAWMETAYLALYALGQFGWGTLSEKVSPRKLVTVGMLASAILSALFGASDVVLVMALAFGLNGLAQSTGWPGNARITASWFGPSERGVVLGWWGTCYQVGPIVAGLISPLLLRFGWRWSLFGPALWVVVVALAFWHWVDDRPPDSAAAKPAVSARPVFLSVLKNSAVWFLGGAYFAIKLTRYALWFWLPYYFEKTLHYSQHDSAYLSLYFDYGGVLGVVLAGYIADRLLGGRRVATAALFLIGLAIVLAVYVIVAAESSSAHAIALFLIGLLLFGADSLVSSVAAQDVGGPEAAGAACGFVNGMGSIGAILQGSLILIVIRVFGDWSVLFNVFVVLAVMGALALAPIVRLKAPEEIQSR